MKTAVPFLGFLLCAAGLAAQSDLPEGVVQIGRISHFALSEGSGLAASRRYPGVIWTHNDGGYQFLFAINRTGEYLGAFQVTGANLIDWEAIAADGQGNLYLADIGANGIERTHVAVHRVREPNPADRHGNAEVNRTWYLRFPAGREDCEAFFVLDGHGYLITKPRTNDQVTMFRYPLSSRSNSTLLEEVAKIPVTAAVTDASLSDDHQRLGVVTTEGVYLYFIHGNPAAMPVAEREFTRFTNDFMEGGTFVDGGFLASAETRELWLFTNASFVCTTPPQILSAPADRSVLPGSTITLEAGVEACPRPVYRWTFNGLELPGRTGASLVLTNITPAHAGLYELTASNRLGIASARVILTVRTKPDLRITEVMPSPAPDATVPTADWWELTSFEAQPVDLSGWRFNDSNGDLTDPFTFGSGPVIAPGESIVFVENLPAPAFIAWWGETNLPPGLQIITYTGNGLSFRVTGDTLLLWDAVSTDAADTVARAVFGAADPGVTFNYDPVTQSFGTRSQFGSNGVLRAASSSDIGSPGRIIEPAPGPDLGSAPVLRVTLAGGKIRLEFEAIAGRRYTLESCDNLAAPDWQMLGQAVETTAPGRVFLEQEQSESRRFYRIRMQ